MALPEWLKRPIPKSDQLNRLRALSKEKSLHTVCESAHCPNLGECFSKNTLTFMILGNLCTRNCRFCAVQTFVPGQNHLIRLDPDEPKNIAKTAKALGLSYVVVTSVTRDDLPDGGAGQFAKTINAIKSLLPESQVEVLVPDFAIRADQTEVNLEALNTVLSAGPTVLNHNVEMTPRLYPEIRPNSNYQRSINLLQAAKRAFPAVCTKSGFMLGLGETEAEIQALLDDLRRVEVDFVTIGQYLPPSKAHFPVQDYITPEKFAEYAKVATQMGFKEVASGPLVRSSYHAEKLWKNH